MAQVLVIPTTGLALMSQVSNNNAFFFNRMSFLQRFTHNFYQFQVWMVERLGTRQWYPYPGASSAESRISASSYQMYVISFLLPLEPFITTSVQGDVLCPASNEAMINDLIEYWRVNILCYNNGIYNPYDIHFIGSHRNNGCQFCFLEEGKLY